jgi:hypothetical protein
MMRSDSLKDGDESAEEEERDIHFVFGDVMRPLDPPTGPQIIVHVLDDSGACTRADWRAFSLCRSETLWEYASSFNFRQTLACIRVIRLLIPSAPQATGAAVGSSPSSRAAIRAWKMLTQQLHE